MDNSGLWQEKPIGMGEWDDLSPVIQAAAIRTKALFSSGHCMILIYDRTSDHGRKSFGTRRCSVSQRKRVLPSTFGKPLVSRCEQRWEAVGGQSSGSILSSARCHL